MATIAASLPRAHVGRARPVTTTVLVSAVAGALYGWMRAPIGRALVERFHQICANVHMSPGDWPCAATSTRALATQVGASILTWGAVALPGVLLAASGRRFTWCVPAGLAALATMIGSALSPNGWSERLFGLVTSPLGSGEPRGAFWYSHAALAVVVDLALVCVPAAAIAFVVRPERRARATTPRRHASWVATFAVVGAIVGVRMLWPRLPIGDFFQVGGSNLGIATGFVALFAAMLGTDRRWWPWSLVPVAVLASLGPTMAVAGMGTRFVVLTWFGGVPPLLVAALIGSLWRPIAMRLSGDRTRPGERSTSRLRPTAILNATAVGLVAVTTIAAAADPLGIQIATPLPSYLGARVLADDVRTKMNLLDAVTAIDDYAARRGGLEGFDATSGERLVPALEWSGRLDDTPLVVTVSGVDDSSVTLVVRSGSGTMFCARTDGTSATYGSAPSHSGLTPVVDLVVRATRRCGSTPLDASAVRMFDVGSMCDAVDDEVLVLCRAVQRGVIEPTLASPTVG